MAGSSHHESSLLQVDDLRVRLGSPPVEAVRGISFTLRRGEILGIAGESGSGKSVAVLSLTRLLPAEAKPVIQGQVQLAGQQGNLLRSGYSTLRHIRGRRIAYVFQEPSSSFNPVFSVRNHLHEVMKVSGVAPGKREGAALEALEEVGIEPTARNMAAYPGEFSGGMLQRLAIAGALVSRPDLLIADEPTTALDTSTQSRIIQLLQRINQQHQLAILFISHDLALLKQLAPRLLVMRKGEIVEQGDAASLLSQPKHSYTRALVDAIPKLVLPEDR